jgi:hypothetical protein
MLTDSTPYSIIEKVTIQIDKKEAFFMAKTTVADRIEQIVRERKIKKADFARSVGVTPNYIYILTGSTETNRDKKLSPTLAKLIEKEYGYPAEWVLTGELPPGKLSKEMAQEMMGLDDDTLRSVQAYLKSLKGGGDE